jgi:hypothetical protein
LLTTSLSCPMSSCNPGSTGSELMPTEIFYGNHTQIWGDVFQLQVWQPPASSLIWRHATIQHRHI